MTAWHLEHFGRCFKNAGVMFMCLNRLQGCGSGLDMTRNMANHFAAGGWKAKAITVLDVIGFPLSVAA
jgi:hypothetical protein